MLTNIVHEYKHEDKTFKLKSSTPDQKCYHYEHLAYDMCFIWNIANLYKYPLRVSIIVSYYFSGAQKWDLKPRC